MNYGIYKNARNASWQCLIDCGVDSLPIKPVQLAKHYGLQCKKISGSDERMNSCSGKIKIIGNQPYIFFNADDILVRQRFSIMHELGHYLLGHLDNDELTSENEEIADLCDVSMQAAKIRARRMEILYDRNMFLSHPLERQVFGQFKDFINKNKSK